MLDLYLPVIFMGLLGFAIAMYVILDGFDLGIGILFPWIRNRDYRKTMMNSVAPVWDGNETWLVFGGALLYGGFPAAYSTLLPILYIPLMLMLCALIFRGVAFEFHFKAKRSKWLWDIAFCVGSTLAALCQGYILGTFIDGYELEHLRQSVPISLTPFNIMTSIGLTVGYALLGATWLIIKTQGSLQQLMFKYAKRLLIALGLFLIIVSAWTPLINENIRNKWLVYPNLLYLISMPVFAFAALLIAYHAIKQHHEKIPFIASVSVFILSFIGLAISLWPYLVPHHLTIWQAASHPSSLSFMLIGATILLPVLLGYSIYAYHVFRGKVDDQSGYNQTH